jgi:preprotein translocase subunit SecG
MPGGLSVNLFAEGASFASYALNLVVIFLSLLIVLIVLIQRGKGGGLAGAFGGAGGSSAFGSRAGDTFTKITLYLALVWVIVIMFHIKFAQSDARLVTTTTTPVTVPEPESK